MCGWGVIVETSVFNEGSTLVESLARDHSSLNVCLPVTFKWADMTDWCSRSLEAIVDSQTDVVPNMSPGWNGENVFRNWEL